jgi:hypothetical protein
LFKLDGEHIINVKNKKALDVKGGKDAEGQTVWVWKRHNGKNQKWRILYTADKGAERTSGENKNFGFDINEPFFVVSRMPMRRVIETNSGNIYLKRRYRMNHGYIKRQQFYFD